MNHVFSVTCCRSGQSLRASGQQPVLSAVCLLRRSWFGTDIPGSPDRVCTSSIRTVKSAAKKPKHSLIQDLRRASIRIEPFIGLACQTSKSSFHSSAIYSKAKTTAKQPYNRSLRRQPTTGGPQFVSGNEQPSLPQEPSRKSRYRRSLPPYQPPRDLNPSGKPISLKSQEWEDCVEAITLDPLSKDQAGKIFGSGLPVDAAQEILQVLQYQRVSGTLDHTIASPQITDNLVANALKFLREKYPFDEDAAIMARIEREYDAEESEIADVDGKPAYVPQQGAETTGVYGTPGLDSMIAEKRAKLEQEAAEEAENAAKREGEAGPPAVRQTFRERAIAARKKESAEWVRKYKQKALLTDGPPPDVPVRERLLPPAIFVVVTVACCLALATFYIPPPRAARMFPDTPPAASTVLTLIALNVAVFIAWHLPPAWRFMNKHFILVAAMPKVSSLLGNIFSHHTPTHMFANLVGIWFIGTWLHDDIGRGNFLATYVGGGVVTSFLALSAYVLRGKLHISTLGASGVVYTLIAARCILHSGEVFRFSFLPEDSEVGIPALWLLGAIVFFELLSLRSAPRAIESRIDTTSHLSGLATGSIIGLLLWWKLRFQEKDLETESHAQAFQSSSVQEDSVGTYNVTVSKPVVQLPSRPSK